MISDKESDFAIEEEFVESETVVTLTTSKGKSGKNAKVKGKRKNLKKLLTGSYVMAVYEGDLFLASVVADQKEVKEGYVRLAYMAMKGKNLFS